MNSKTTLELRDINQFFNDEYLFDEDVNLCIEQNSATLLYGGSGSGKTSLLNVLIALVTSTKGGVYWDDNLITSLKEANELRANYMSVLFSNFSFISELSIKENILLAATLCEVQNTQERLKEITETILNFKDIDENIDLATLIQKDSVNALSNGQKEIIVLASTLLLQTKFFIGDEMLRSFPDDIKVILFKRLIEYFKKYKIGFLYVTHWPEAVDIMKESGFTHKVYKIQKKKLQLQLT
jgi:ABC-type lipoprotein export system ATPase subunit